MYNTLNHWMPIANTNHFKITQLHLIWDEDDISSCQRPWAHEYIISFSTSNKKSTLCIVILNEQLVVKVFTCWPTSNFGIVEVPQLSNR